MFLAPEISSSGLTAPLKMAAALLTQTSTRKKTAVQDVVKLAGWFNQKAQISYGTCTVQVKRPSQPLAGFCPKRQESVLHTKPLISYH